MEKSNQFIFEFKEKKPELDVWYRGSIRKFYIKEQDMDKVLKVKVNIPELENVFTYSVYISSSEYSRFYDFATNMELIREDGRADLRRLNCGYDVWVSFTDTERGIFIDTMVWANDEDEEGGEENEE